MPVTVDSIQKNPNATSPIVAFADITVNNIKIHGIMIRKNHEGILSIKFPNKEMKNGNLKKIVYPTTSELYTEVKLAILKEYHNVNA